MFKNGTALIELPDSHHTIGEDIMFSANGSPFKRGKVSRRRLEVSYLEFGTEKQTLVGDWVHDVVTTTGEIFTVGDTWDTYRSVINRSGSLLTCLKRSDGNYGRVAHTFDIDEQELKSLYPAEEYLNYNPTDEDLENTDHLFR